jgi:hypothetical protein
MTWQDDALCAGLDTEEYFDKYELDIKVAQDIDRMCLGCPVIKECFDYGVSTESWGVWGGVYLVDGRIDNSKNFHKTQEKWNKLLQVIK